jgi:Right handed beta helix region
MKWPSRDDLSRLGRLRDDPWHLRIALALVIGLGSFVLTWHFLGGRPDLPSQPEDEPPAIVSGAASRRLSPPTAPGDTAPATEEEASSRILDPPARASARSLTAFCEHTVQVRPPAADFANTVAAAEPGTCFELQAGEYRFHDVVPKDRMTFLGVGRDKVVVVGSGDAENAFHGTAQDVSIGRMTLKGFQGTGGQKPQQQAAIRGSVALWKTGSGQLARDWLIEDVEASNNFALGLLLGDEFTVRGSTFADNGVAGIGGAQTHGGLLEGNVVSGNGASQLGGYQANGGGMKFTEALSPDDPLVVNHNEVHHNKGVGVWCDIGCTGFQVIDNYIHDQDSHGVMFELSSQAVIRGNLIVNANTWSDFSNDFNAGAITVGESSDVVIEDNYVDGAVAGIIVRQTKRPVLPQEQFLYNYPTVNWAAGNVHVRSNVVVNTKAMGISSGKTGAGLIGDLSSIRYEANTYGNPASMIFWWDGGNRYSFKEWQASGRDKGSSSDPPARPAWTALNS